MGVNFYLQHWIDFLMPMSEPLQTFKWYLPTTMRCREPYLEFDITDACKVFFAKAEYVKRKIKFDKEHDFDQAFLQRVRSVRINMHPFTSEPLSNFKVANKIVAAEIGNLPDHEHIFQRGNLRKAKGLVIVEIQFTDESDFPANLTLVEEDDIEKIMDWDFDFESLQLQLISVANDVCSFFLLGLHMTFPTHSSSHSSSRAQSSGLVAMIGKTVYIRDVHSDMMGYPLLIEKDRLEMLNFILGRIAQVWHKDIWSFHRFIKAVRSDYTTIDHFLDLVFTLESFFDKNTSSETIRLVVAALTSRNKAAAKATDQLLVDCFRIRNEVAHGGVNFRLYDKSPRIPKGKEKHKMILELYWELKNLNLQLIELGISKLIADKNPVPANAIRFGAEDLMGKLFLTAQ